MTLLVEQNEAFTQQKDVTRLPVQQKKDCHLLVHERKREKTLVFLPEHPSNEL